MFNAIGRPPGSLTREQIARLREEGTLALPEHLKLSKGELTVSVPQYGLAVLVVDGR